MQYPTALQARFQMLIESLEGAYAPNTIREYRRDMQEFISFSEENDAMALPASPETVAAFLQSRITLGLKSSSIVRRARSISSLHLLAGLPDPTKSMPVQLALRKVYRTLGRRFEPAYPITRELLARMLHTSGDDLRGLRDRALLQLGYQSLRRREELTSLCAQDLVLLAQESSLQLRRKKEDQTTTGHWIHLDAAGTMAVREWLEAAGIKDGFILRGVTTKDEVTASLSGSQVSRIIKRLARQAGCDEATVRSISGNSLRVGATRELLLAGATLVQIMQKAGWEKQDTIMRYLERDLEPGMVREDQEWDADTGAEKARAILQVALELMDGAYSPITLRSYESSMEAFIGFCQENALIALPATPETVASYLEVLSVSGLKSTTLRGRLSAIAAVHKLSGMADPVATPMVRLAMRRAYRTLGRQSKQAYGITRIMLHEMLEAAMESPLPLRRLRDQALLLLAYDSLRRRSELMGLQVEDLEFGDAPGGAGAHGARVLLRRSKTDQYGAGHWIHLSTKTASALKLWIDTAGLRDGPILRSLNRQGEVEAKGLGEGRISNLYKQLAKRAGFEDRIVGMISSHSMRVGAAQDLLQEGATLQEIMQKGGWSKVDTVMHYIERTRPPGAICEEGPQDQPVDKQKLDR